MPAMDPYSDTGGGGGGGNGGGGKGGKGGGGGNTVKAGKDPIGFAYAYLISKGYSPAGAAGIVGNLRAESGMRTGAVGDGGTSIGIAQWHLGRADNLRAFAQARGENVYSLRTQLDFLVHELKQYDGLDSRLRSTKNVYDATSMFMKEFERPADTSDSAVAGRAQLSTQTIRQEDPNANYVGGYGGSGPDGGGGGGGVGAYGGGGFSAGKQDTLSGRELAEEAGWSYSFLKTQPELWKLFKTAVAERWSPARFTSAMRDTKWFQSNSDTVRQAQVLRKTDPATWEQRVASTASDLMDRARAMGANLSQKEAERFARQSIMFGFSEGDLNNILAEQVTRKNGSFVGEAGANEDQLREYARSMGVRISGDYIKKVVQGMATGDLTFEQAQDRIDRWAISAYPTLADNIKNGETVAEAADAYVQTVKGLLELPDGEVDLFDPLIRKALVSRDKDNKPAMKSLWEFEQDVKRDDRWQYTKNARQEVDQVTMGVLKDWGLA